MKCTEKACAKVNLTLCVGNKRQDGYHEVTSVMQRISLWDTVTVQRGTGRDRLLCDAPVTEDENDNLCMRAAKVFFAETGLKSDGVTVTLEKRIPMQAGLGGGSSDDDLYNQAVAIVRNDKKTSISYVQRRLRIGYNRAAVLIERMEEEGVLSPADHTGKREIL